MVERDTLGRLEGEEFDRDLSKGPDDPVDIEEVLTALRRASPEMMARFDGVRDEVYRLMTGGVEPGEVGILSKESGDALLGRSGEGPVVLDGASQAGDVVNPGMASEVKLGKGVVDTHDSEHRLVGVRLQDLEARVKSLETHIRRHHLAERIYALEADFGAFLRQRGDGDGA